MATAAEKVATEKAAAEKKAAERAAAYEDEECWTLCVEKALCDRFRSNCGEMRISRTLNVCLPSEWHVGQKCKSGSTRESRERYYAWLRKEGRCGTSLGYGIPCKTEEDREAARRRGPPPDHEL